MKSSHRIATAAVILPVLAVFAVYWRTAPLPLAVIPPASPTDESVASRATTAVPSAPVIPAESERDPVERILTLPETARLKAATELVLSLAGQPDLASEVARDFALRDSAFIREHGTVLITALTGRGDFVGALVFAELGGPERPLWLAQTLAAWANEEPALAAQAALTELDGEGFPEIAAIWARRDPVGLAAFARGLPDGFPRTFAFERLRAATPE